MIFLCCLGDVRVKPELTVLRSSRDEAREIPRGLDGVIAVVFTFYMDTLPLVLAFFILSVVTWFYASELRKGKVSFGLMFSWWSDLASQMSLNQSCSDVYLIESKLWQPVARLW